MTKDEAIANGTPYACTECPAVYPDVPRNLREFWVDGKDIPRCQCGCDHIVDLREIDCHGPFLEFHPASGMVVSVS